MKLIGLSGFARSGKDTVGDYFTKNFRFVRYGFADPLKKSCAEMFGIPLDHFYNPEFKEVVNEFWDISPREMAQKMGTECGRQVFRDDIWIKRAELEYIQFRDNFNAGGMVITDVRFANEAQWINDMGGTMIHIERPGFEGAVGLAGHASEAGYPNELKHHIIVNDGTIEDLYKKVNHALGATV